jgi:hypothetical protein
LFKGAIREDPERLHRIEPRIFVRVRLSSRFLDSCALSASHPLRSPRKSPSCPREDRPHRATRSLRQTPFGFFLGSRERYFSPTSATNSLTRALVNRSTPERKAFAFTTGAVFTAPSPRHLSATRSQVEAGLTARLQLQPYRSLSFLRKTGPTGHFAAALSTACEADDRPLTLPLASRVNPGFPRSRQNTRTAAHLFRVNERGLFSPERLLPPDA